jgi:hypothetical protein
LLEPEHVSILYLFCQYFTGRIIEKSLDKMKGFKGREGGGD